MPKISSFADARLLQSIAEGSREALAELYVRYAAEMLMLALRILHDRAEAEDLLHDVFIQAWQHAAAYDERRSSVRRWLWLRTRCRALDRRRQLARRRAVSADGLTWLEGERASPEVFLSALRAAVLALPEAAQELLNLLFCRGLSSTEVAELQACPIGTVKSQKRATLRALRAALTPQPANVI